MVGLGTRSIIERVESGNSRPKAARASALPDRRRRAERASGYDTRERLWAHESCHHTPTGQCIRVADALPEEPDALIAHVRVCGRAGWVTTGSTRQGVIRDIGGGACPPHDQPPLIEQQTEFAPDDP